MQLQTMFSTKPHSLTFFIKIFCYRHTFVAAVLSVFMAKSNTFVSLVVLVEVLVDGVPWRGNVREAIPG